MIKISPNTVRFVVQVTVPIPGVDWVDHADFEDDAIARACAAGLRRDLANSGYDNIVRIVKRELVETEMK